VIIAEVQSSTLGDTRGRNRPADVTEDRRCFIIGEMAKQIVVRTGRVEGTEGDDAYDPVAWTEESLPDELISRNM
jgi:hypothetical protein